ncbi:MAG: hypothetical protein K1X91_01510 [Bacteriodetes bacterium]|nr:hypothetical protein [Bacteroidota bacterium]
MINIETLSRVEQILKRTLEGLYGGEVKEFASRMKNSKDADKQKEFYIEMVHILYSKSQDESNQQLLNIGMDLCDDFIQFYKRAKLEGNTNADSLLLSPFIDFPNIEGSKLLSKYMSLIEASIAYKSALNSLDYMLVFESSKNVLLSGYEFIDGIIPFIIACRSEDSITNNKVESIFRYSFKSKIEDLNNKTYDGEFQLFKKISNNNFRNALAHRTLFHDRDNNIIIYNDRDKEFKIDIVTYTAYATVCSYIPFSYMLFVIIHCFIIQYPNDIYLLPERIQKVIK